MALEKPNYDYSVFMSDNEVVATKPLLIFLKRHNEPFKYDEV